MALTERTEIGKVEVVGQWRHVQVREDTVIERDGEEISRSHHRYVIAPGDGFEHPDTLVKAICVAAHTTELVEQYQQSLEQE